MRHASKSGRVDYASYHNVRKAGKKVRYLLDFFKGSLSKTRLKSTKGLKKLQKRFGALNNVVASEESLRTNQSMSRNDKIVGRATTELQNEQKERVRAAAKLLL
jgi:CHAD domain-containing protein